MTSRLPDWGGGVLVIGMWGLAFSVAAHLTSSPAQSGTAPEMTDWLLGESRQALSVNLYNEADLYFHKGVAHRESIIPIPGPFQHWQADITPAQHVHAEGAASAEILPWLKLAMRADPHNVDAFLVSSFWANTGLHRQDLAREILNEAQRLNPGDYRVALEKGRLAIEARRFTEAHAILETALTLYAHTPRTPDLARDFALDQAEILTFLGFIRETEGDRTGAIQSFKNALAIFPERSYIKDRIGLLEAGQKPPESAQSLLEKITRKSVHDACKDHDHDDMDHDE